MLPKSGDLSNPGNFRGIVLLEIAYKIIAIFFKIDCDQLPRASIIRVNAVLDQVEVVLMWFLQLKWH